MLFLPKRFKYNLNCEPIIILNKLQKHIKPSKLNPKYSQEYDFRGYITGDIFNIRLNPPWNPLVRKGFICPYLLGKFKLNGDITELTVEVKFRKSDYFALLLFVLLFVVIGVICFEDSNVVRSFLVPLVEFGFLYAFFVFMARIEIRDVIERLEDILIEYRI